MTDLSEIKASGSVKIAGAATTGAESDFMKVSPKQDAGTSDIQDDSVVQTVVDITDTEVQFKVGGSNKIDRKELVLENVDSNPVFVGPTGVTDDVGDPVTQGGLLGPGAIRSFPYGPGIDWFGIARSGVTARVIVTESA